MQEICPMKEGPHQMLREVLLDEGQRVCTLEMPEYNGYKKMHNNHISDTYTGECGEDTEIDNREMRGDTEWKRYLAHAANILHQISCAMAECGRHHSEEGEQQGRPGVQEGHEEMVGMDTTLGSKNKVHQEYESQNSEGQGWLEREDGWSMADDTAGDDFQIAKQ